MLKDGKAYRNRPMTDAFHRVHEFIEVGWAGEKVYETMEAAGRLNVVSLYMTYVMREMRRSQDALPGYVRLHFGPQLPAFAGVLLRRYQDELTID